MSQNTGSVLFACCNEGSTAARCSTDYPQEASITWHSREIPKLTINCRCLRQASAPGWPGLGLKVVSHQLRGYPATSAAKA
jgi:hypothetical protein